MDKRELLVAKKVIIMYLSEEKRIDSEKAIHEINNNDEVLKEYLKAVKGLFETAIEQLEEDDELIELL